MNQIPDWKNIPSGNNPQRPAAQKRSAGLLFSGILIAVSLLAFVLPLAAYHVAQVASVLRVRSSIFLLLGVSFTLYAFGILGQLPVFAMAGTTGILCSPLLAFVLILRSRDRSVWWALVILALPVAFLLLSLMQVPQGFNIHDWIVGEFAKIPDRPGLNKEQLLQQLTTSQAFEPIQKLFNLADWQRVGWFLFWEGGALSVSVLASLIGTLALIDLAFTQAERIRGVIAYVLQKTNEFPRQMVDLLEQTHRSLSGLAAGVSQTAGGENRRVSVLTHEKGAASATRADKTEHPLKLLLGRILREPTPTEATEVLGYRFNFSNQPGWNFRAFAVPLRASVPALALLVYLASLWKGDDALSQWLPAEPLGAWLVWGAFVSLAVLTGLALQGALVLHARMRPFAALSAVLLVLILVSGLQGGALTVVAILAGLGLLDSAYDFRKRLAKFKNAV